MRAGRVAVAAFVLAAPAQAASHVERGYLPLSDGTQLHYTLTRPDGAGRHPVLLKYDGYDAGVYSDPSWNESGYITLGVNFRGTGCSQGVFGPLRADQWGADGAEVVDWAARQPWSSGSVGMIGYSFTGVSQVATAAFAGPALKAIAPGNVFLDFYRDSIYPGGIHNGWIPLWIAAGRQFVVGSDTVTTIPPDPQCLLNMAPSQAQAAAQAADTQLHSFVDDYWSTQPASYLDRVSIPVLGCVNWQDTTIYSRAANAFRDHLDPATTWLVGSNGAHADCAISRARLQRFFDHYLRQQQNGWERTPRVLLVHEVAGDGGVRETLGDDAGAWQSDFASWSAMASAIKPVELYLHADGRLDQSAPMQSEPAAEYRYPAPSNNTPADWTGGVNPWSDPRVPGTVLSYTTPAFAEDTEFLGEGSVDLWFSSTAGDADVQVTLMELRADGQETYVQNGWLRLSHRRLDATRSTALRPVHTHLPQDAEALPAGVPVAVRIEVLPFNHVFRAGSALRLQIDAPGGWFQVLPTPALNRVHHPQDRPSVVRLGWLPGARAGAALAECGTLLNQPCRLAATPMPPGTIRLRSGPAAAGTERSRNGGTWSLWSALLLLSLALLRRDACSRPG